MRMGAVIILALIILPGCIIVDDEVTTITIDTKKVDKYPSPKEEVDYWIEAVIMLAGEGVSPIDAKIFVYKYIVQEPGEISFDRFKDYICNEYNVHERYVLPFIYGLKKTIELLKKYEKEKR